MAPFLTRAGHASVLVVEVIAIVWIGMKVLERATRTRFREQLMVKDNPAAGVTLGGFYLALFIALSGVLGGKQGTPAHDLLLTAMHGAVAISAIALCSFLWQPIVRVSLHEDILASRNVAAGLLSASALVATGLIYKGAVHLEEEHAEHVAAFFLLGEGALLLSLLLYEWVTPYDVYGEIHERSNAAAALSCSGAVLAAGLILGNAVEGEFESWSSSIRDALLYMIPVLVLPLVRFIVVNGLFLGFGSVNREITQDRNTAAGMVEGAAYVGVALLIVELLK
jgi:uncharacterized membrane protein YjfL (UPF0719 family)